MDKYLQMIIEKNTEMLKDSSRIKALLMDCFPQDKLLRNILFVCVEEKIVDELSEKTEVDMRELYSYKQRIVNSYGCSEDIAEKAIVIWIDAMNIVLIRDNKSDSKKKVNSTIKKSKGKFLYINLNDEESSFWGKNDGYFELIFDVFMYEDNVLANIVFTQIYLDDYIDIIDQLMDNLTEKEKCILCNFYGLRGLEKISLTKISELLHESRYSTQNLYTRALRKLRHPSRSRKMCIKQFGYVDETFIKEIDYPYFLENIMEKEVQYYEKIGDNKGYFFKNVIEKHRINEIKDIDDDILITRVKLGMKNIQYLLEQGVFTLKESFEYLSFRELWENHRDIAFYMLNYTDPVLIIRISKKLYENLKKYNIDNYKQLIGEIDGLSAINVQEINELIHMVDDNNKIINDWFMTNGITNNDRVNCRITEYGRVEKYKYIRRHLEELNLNDTILERLNLMGIETIYDLINMGTDDFFDVMNKKNDGSNRNSFELRRIKILLDVLADLGTDEKELISKYEEYERRKKKYLDNKDSQTDDGDSTDSNTANNNALFNYPELVFDDEELPFV